MQTVAALEWELASFTRRRRLVFVRRGALAPWATVALLALLAVARTIRSVTLAGTVPLEHLVQRDKNRVNCGARGAVSPLYYYLICK